MTQGSHVITRLLLAWNEGDKDALDRLAPLVYAELRRLAKSSMRKGRAGHTLQTTALINEAYLRLIDAGQVEWRNRARFFVVGARAMRQILWLRRANAAVKNAAAARGRSRWTRRW